MASPHAEQIPTVVATLYMSRLLTIVVKRRKKSLLHIGVALLTTIASVLCSTVWVGGELFAVVACEVRPGGTVCYNEHDVANLFTILDAECVHAHLHSKMIPFAMLLKEIDERVAIEAAAEPMRPA